jgi:MFS transporter, FHS family, glucose/mannose:H+ symporter
VHLGWALVAYLCIFAYGLCDNSRGPIFPDLLRDFSLSDSAGSLFFLVASGAALLNNLFSIGLMERKGALWAVKFYCFLQIVGFLFIGFSPSFFSVLVGAAIFGASLGGNGIAVNILIAEASPVRIRRQMLAGLHCLYGLSSLLAPFFVTFMYHLGFGWKVALAWLSLGPAVVLGVTFLPWIESSVEARVTRELPDPIHPDKQLLRNRPWGPVMYYGAIISLYVVAELTISTRLVLFARRECGYSVEQANLLLSGFFLTLFLGRLYFALFKIPLRNRVILRWSAATGLVCFALGILVNPLWLSLAGLAFSLFYPGAIAYINDEMPAPQAAFVTSWGVTIQNLALVFMQFILGELTDRFSLGKALWLGPVCLAISLGFLLIRPGENRFFRGSRTSFP